MGTEPNSSFRKVTGGGKKHKLYIYTYLKFVKIIYIYICRAITESI